MKYDLSEESLERFLIEMQQRQIDGTNWFEKHIARRRVLDPIYGPMTTKRALQIIKAQEVAGTRIPDQVPVAYKWEYLGSQYVAS